MASVEETAAAETGRYWWFVQPFSAWSRNNWYIFDAWPVKMADSTLI